MMGAALKLQKQIVDMGFEALIVGGAVRDIVMGVSPKDIDIATNMPMDLLEKHFTTHNIGQSKDFGILLVLFEDFDFEVAQFRKDGKYENGRHPTSVTITSSFHVDSSRRDFTINSMGLSVDGRLQDFHGGEQDINRRQIATVGLPIDRFREDGLRMMRAVRFAARLGFSIEPETKEAIKLLSHKLSFISKERIKDELCKMASMDGDRFADAVVLMAELDILKTIMRGLHDCMFLPHTPRDHPEGAVLDHTIAALRVNEEPNYLINVAILLHDIGKNGTHKFEDGKHKYHGHEALGVTTASIILNTYKFSNDEKEAILFAIGNHMRMMHVHEMKKSKVFRLVSNPNWPILKQVSFCDKSSREDRYDLPRFHAAMKKYEDIAAEWKEKLDSKPHIVSGHYVMELLGLKPGPKVGQILNGITDWAIENGITNLEDLESQLLIMAEGI